MRNHRMTYERLADRTHDLDVHQKSIDYVRWLSCVYENDGPLGAGELFQLRWPLAIHRETIQKAAVAAGTATDASWGGPLSPIKPLSEAFLSYVRPISVLGRLPVRRVPFNCSLPALTAPTSSGWAGEGAPKPISKGALTTVTLAIAKAVDIIVLTDELMRLAVPASEVALRDELANAIAQFLDQQFIDPAVAAVGGVNPASITNGVAAITPSGTTAAALVKDVGALIGQFVTNNPDTTSAVLLMTPAVATMLVGATNSLTLTIGGGSYAGLPVVVSGNVGARIVALDAAQVLYADGGIEIDLSKHATIQMVDVADNPVVAGTIETSLWAANLVGVRAERTVNWKKARATAVSLISPAAYVPGT